ncbi:uncharacterized protein LOC133843811 [Drosophila sulfurigaster albostrigata]|uniref:uncharacterized protein LOC133843811 n=1 Tax=Drosophila sulfurigaster albostrigata TaxID=89887 RepID=UPI002D21A139|nr:uncharacterized protein LOC133843811 [Drosophila sulfurigaster albostrigata]
MKIINQSYYEQSVFSPEKDWSLGDSQESHAHKILDTDLAINDNLSSTSSQIFRAPCYNDSPNYSKPSLSGNCLIDSDISKIPEKSVELFVNKSLIQNSESDPEIIMKIINQSYYEQSVFSPEKDWSLGDSQESHAHKILDTDLAINDNLSSTSSQIFRAPCYNDSPNYSKPSLSGNCLIDSDISKIPEKSVELFVNKSLIQNSESDPEIIMKIINQSYYEQSVFSPEKDWSLGDSQESHAHKILDTDLAINDNLSSTSSQIFRAPCYNDSPNYSKPSLSGNCLIDSDISKIPEKSVELFVNKSLIQNSESDPEIIMKIINQSYYEQSVFSPEKDWSLGDSQESHAHKILDTDLAINDNLSSTSSQIFRAPCYNDSPNYSKPSLSGNCLIDSDISKIPEKSVELFVNKSLIQNSESDPEIIMKIINQSYYEQSVFSPEKDWSLGDSQESHAHKILDTDLAINDNLSSTSSQIFRAPCYNDSPNYSKPSLSGNCLIDSDISKIPEKSVDFIDIADEDFHPNTPEKREAENGPDEIVEVVLYDPDGNPVIVNFRVLRDV